MAQKKESFFWTSYSDLMTSLFFIMLVLFILVIVVLYKRMEVTEQQKEVTEQLLEEIQKVVDSTKDLSRDYFRYRPEYKKYVLDIAVRYPVGESDINEIEAANKEETLRQLYLAGKEIQKFLNDHAENQYILIVEGQASLDSYRFNYELSYKRALGLLRFWIEQCGILFGGNCEIQISGSGDGQLDTHSMREPNEKENQRFLIHILPKNIFEQNEN